MNIIECIILNGLSPVLPLDFIIRAKIKRFDKR